MADLTRLRAPIFSSLRARLIILVLITILPAFVLTIQEGLEARRLATEAAQAEAMRLAHLISTNQENILEDTRQLLSTLAQFLRFEGIDPSSCDELLAKFAAQTPRYTTLFLVGLQGQVICSAVPVTEPMSFNDRPWFQQALRTGEFTVGEYVIGRISGKAALPIAYPILDANKRVSSILTVGLDLDWLNQLALQVWLPAGSSITVIDRNHTILYRYPDPEAWIGKIAPETENLQPALSEPTEGTREATGEDGVRRLYAYMPLASGTRTKPLAMLVGIPTVQVYQDVNREIGRDAVLLVLVLILSAWLAWYGGEVLLLRQIKDLVGVSRRLEEGDLSARSSLTSEAGEIGQLATAFNDMAEALRELAVRDELTGLYNRRELRRRLAEEVERYQRHGRPFSLAILDIDHFKDINDVYGHPVGDEILKEFGQQLCSQVRSLDWVARYGGEEFTIIMPETHQTQAVLLAERIRHSVAGHTFKVSNSQGDQLEFALTVTIGVGEITSSFQSKEALIEAVDQALYEGKNAGRNCSVPVQIKRSK